ncbi:MAG TPA: hypothetical protein VEG60_00165 [Candidatus Binatia bacterium]|nr:hypothetical protein [Candidatus Binatia bacterium]
MKLFSMIVLAAVVTPAAATSAEYYIYKETGGNILLSNLAVAEPSAAHARGSLALVKTYRWPDATAEDIAATEKENREAARTSALRDLAFQTERLADELQRSNDLALAALRQQTLRPSTEINQVIVAQGLRRSRVIGR